MKKKYIKIISYIAIGAIWIYGFLDLRDSDKKDKLFAKQLKEEFPSIDRNRNMAIEGVIYNKELGLKQYTKGAMYVTLNNGQKFSIGGSTGNDSYDESNIMDFIQKNDSILKKENDDVIIIYRDTMKYYFILGQIIK